VEDYIAKVRSETNKPSDPLEIVVRVITKSSWHPDDTAALNAMSEDEVFDWMRTNRSERFIRLLREIIKIWSGHSEDATGFCQKVQAAAERLAASSFLNEQRVRNVLGVVAVKAPEDEK
jgi:myo-inositol catabolism protein IolC